MLRILSFLVVLLVSFTSLAANEQKLQTTLEDSAKTICNAYHQKYLRRNKDAFKNLVGYNTEIVDSCAAIKVQRDKKCNADFMVKFTELAKGKKVDAAFKEEAKKTLVPDLQKCFLKNGTTLATEMETVIQLFHFGKIEDARTKLVELKK
jgi:hypothetical protein